ncbi:uncharacterized protein LOC116248116 isoform X1 [Nymphaea colorata]|nr:uncharacterized protein LOC116248116 isoform X1 [Nymphaea colorata]
MEGAGSTRLGRSSTRYVSTTVFSGPVRKWKKQWVEISPPSAANNNNSSSNNHNHGHNPPSSSLHNSSTSASSSSHLLLYKWTPATASSNGATANGTATASNGNKDDSSPTPSEEPPRRKFRYIPIVALEEEEQKKEASSEVDEETRQNDGNSTEGNKGDGDTAPNSTDLEMEDSQEFKLVAADFRKACQVKICCPVLKFGCGKPSLFLVYKIYVCTLYLPSSGDKLM